MVELELGLLEVVDDEVRDVATDSSSFRAAELLDENEELELPHDELEELSGSNDEIEPGLEPELDAVVELTPWL